MDEPVAGIAADRVGDPLACAVEGLKQAKLEARPQRVGDDVGGPRGCCRGVVEVELATDARERTQHLPVNGAKLVEVAAQELGGRGGDLDRGEHAQVPTRVAGRPDRDECAFALCAVQQLTYLQRIALGPLVEFGGYVAQVRKTFQSFGLLKED